MRESATLLVPDDQQDEGNEIEHEPPAPPDDERGGEQHEHVAVGRQRQPEGEHLRTERDQERDERQDGGRAVDVGAWGPPALAAILAAALAVAVRLPFVHAPLTADEGGYGEVARLWPGHARQRAAGSRRRP